MELRRTLANVFSAAHPADAATVLESRSTSETALVLRSLPTTTAAGVLRRMAPAPAVRLLQELEPEDAAQLLVELPLQAAARLLRSIPNEYRERILAAFPPDLARELRAVVRFPGGTAGALMDPRALTLHGDLTVQEANVVVQREAQHALYNLYVVDRDGVLTGVLNLQELLRASPRDRLETIVRPAHHRLVVTADPHAVVAHPGWREVYSLPVVDDQGRFVGAVRYRTLRRVEGELREPDPAAGGLTSAALGDLFRTGIVGMIDALSATLAPPPGKGPSGAHAAKNPVDVHTRESRREEAGHEPDAEE